VINSPYVKKDVQNFIDKSIIQKVEQGLESKNTDYKRNNVKKKFSFAEASIT
jgi:hypothetical protein